MTYTFIRKSLVVMAVIFLSACDVDDESSINTEVIPSVTVVNATEAVLDVNQELPGRVHAVRTAQVQARVAGIVKKRLFTEGAEVKEGDVLFLIDPAPFEADLERANAEVKRTEAMAADAKSTLDRYRPLANIQAISQQDLVTTQTAYKTALANVAVARANAKKSLLDVEYATVRAPISGRIGRSLVTEGALVGQDGATALATIQQIDRVFVDLTQSVADVIALREGMEGHSLTSSNSHITARVDGSKKTINGKLLFTDISVEPTSGQLTLRGEFENPEFLLLPGMYVRVTVSKGEMSDAILLPQRAVQFDSSGVSSLLIVNNDNLVEKRTVHTGQMYGPSWHIVDGVTTGERIIVGGPQVIAGQKVTTLDSLSNK
ncbi:efflux RND transporter periplasmic adaptor subunit [Yersinia canariae]|uniref:Efflux RND transporter periplasmic adaptor subunit n=1 Tax=Yersinia canariae TaxID=2607663 RepID=A0A857F042_9GAMM|nr:efflux RND transporter periplasmic adaptor subunit [Yersinia canariae]QHB32848.1 efflux RND transporter periplasmic adaptor subunit [Yersinia canariae]